jgi:hypothetical protein
MIINFNNIKSFDCCLFRFVNSIRQMLPLFMVLSWIFTVSMNVKDIVYEKEKYVKQNNQNNFSFKFHLDD